MSSPCTVVFCLIALKRFTQLQSLVIHLSILKGFIWDCLLFVNVIGNTKSKPKMAIFGFDNHCASRTPSWVHISEVENMHGWKVSEKIDWCGRGLKASYLVFGFLHGPAQIYGKGLKKFNFDSNTKSGNFCCFSRKLAKHRLEIQNLH